MSKIWIDGKLPARQETRLVGGKGVMEVGLNNRGCTTVVILERTRPFRGGQITILTPNVDGVMIMDIQIGVNSQFVSTSSPIPAEVFQPQVSYGVMLNILGVVLDILKPEAEISMLLRNDSDEDKYFVAVITGELL